MYKPGIHWWSPFLALAACSGSAEPVCGDGVLQAPELCDDGNQRSDDMCAADCRSHGALAAGGFHSCRLHVDGQLVCWGLNDRGQASPPGGSCPVPTVPENCARSAGGGRYEAVAVGDRHGCVLEVGGVAVCWGTNGENQSSVPGSGCVSTGRSHICAEARGTGRYSSVAAGAYHSCAILTADQTVECWGNDLFGEASPPAGVGFESIAGGYYHVCGLALDGTLRCWGRDDDGQSSAPTGSGYASIAAGFGHSCAVDRDGEVLCWGDNRDGQSNPPAGPFVALAAGVKHTCGIRTDGTLECWGGGQRDGACDFASGWQCGQALPPAGQFLAVASGDIHACALRVDGQVLCWGAGSQSSTCMGAACGQAFVPE